MTYYTRFYTRDFMSGKPIRVCGKGSTVVLDGQVRLGRQIRLCRQHMDAHSFIGFQILTNHGTTIYSEGETP